MDKKLKVAIAGAGRWGTALIDVFSRQADIRYCLYAGAEATRHFLEKIYPAIKPTVSLQQILDDKTIEAVVVATPASTHFGIASACLNAGKHVFLEKPGGINSVELERLCEVAVNKRRVLAVGYKFVHHPVFKKIRTIFRKESLIGICFEWNKWGTFDEPIVPHLLSHEISLFCALGFHAPFARHYAQQGVVSKADIIDVTFESGHATIYCHINRVSPTPQKSVTFVGASRSFIWSNNELFEITASSRMPVQVEQENPVVAEANDFLRSIYEGSTPLANGHFALAVFKTIESINAPG